MTMWFLLFRHSVKSVGLSWPYTYTSVFFCRLLKTMNETFEEKGRYEICLVNDSGLMQGLECVEMRNACRGVFKLSSTKPLCYLQLKAKEKRKKPPKESKKVSESSVTPSEPLLYHQPPVDAYEETNSSVSHHHHVHFADKETPDVKQESQGELPPEKKKKTKTDKKEKKQSKEEREKKKVGCL